jgi:hypothetical protein
VSYLLVRRPKFTASQVWLSIPSLTLSSHRLLKIAFTSPLGINSDIEQSVLIALVTVALNLSASHSGIFQQKPGNRSHLLC